MRDEFAQSCYHGKNTRTDSSKYTVSATNNITGETIIQKHGTTAPESVTSQDTKTQDTEDATQAPPPKNHKIQHHKPRTRIFSHSP